MTNGNLILDLPVPPESIIPLQKSNKETGYTRYAAITRDPDDFENRGSFLRQGGGDGSTELFICVTMHNVRPAFALNLHDLTQFQIAGGRGLVSPDLIRIDEEYRTPVFWERLAHMRERCMKEATLINFGSTAGK